MAMFAGISYAADKAVKPEEGNAHVAAEKAKGGRADMEALYKEAGVSDEQIAKLKDVSEKLKEARKAKDGDKVKELVEARKSILTAEQQEKVKELMKEKGLGAGEKKAKDKDKETSPVK
jgi:Spy/CpxP family protein refolding chaperone